MFRKLKEIIIITVLVFSSISIPSVPTLAQDIIDRPIENGIEIDSQTTKVSLLQKQKTDLKSKINALNRENQAIEADIIELGREKLVQEDLIITAEERISVITSEDSGEKLTEEQIDEEKKKNESQIETWETRIEEINEEISKKEDSVAENNEERDLLENDLGQLEKDLSKEINILQSQVVILGISFSRYIILIAAYWLIYQIVKFITFKLTKKTLVRNFILLITGFLAIGATVLTLLIAFIGNLAILVTSFGFISAAMVVALQEFISSFFAWFVIKARGPYKEGDLIQIQTSVQVYSGKVKNIGIFRTVISEKVGGSSLDREQLTGKTVDFPNNLILKHPVKNFTQENAILWNNLDIIVTYESNYKLAREIIEKTMDEYFSYALDHKDTYLDDVFNLGNIYKPKIYMSLAGDGPCFTIWFACKTGKLREVIERLSISILDEFNSNQIDIAYKTSRVIPTADFDNEVEIVNE